MADASAWHAPRFAARVRDDHDDVGFGDLSVGFREAERADGERHRRRESVQHDATSEMRFPAAPGQAS